MPCVVCILGRIKSVFSTISTLFSQLSGVCPFGHLVFVFSANTFKAGHWSCPWEQRNNYMSFILLCNLVVKCFGRQKHSINFRLLSLANRMISSCSHYTDCSGRRSQFSLSLILESDIWLIICFGYYWNLINWTLPRVLLCLGTLWISSADINRWRSYSA